MSHLDQAVLHELVDGEIPSSELGPITAHLASCAACRARLDEARALVADVDELIETIEVPVESAPRERTPAPATPRRWLAPLAWAATVVIAVGLGYTARAGLEPGPAEKIIAPSAPTGTPMAQESVARETPLAGTQPQPARPASPAPGGTGTSVAAAAKTREPTVTPPALAQAPAANGAVATAADRRTDALSQKAALDVDSAARRASTLARVDSAARLASGLSQVGEQSRSFAAPATRGGRGGNGTRFDSLTPNALVARDNANRPAALSLRVDTISLPDAMRRLGGTIRLIDGLVPLRLEAQGLNVLVVYPGELILQQQLIDGRVVYELSAPPRFTADSLARLRARIRE